MNKTAKIKWLEQLLQDEREEKDIAVRDLDELHHRYCELNDLYQDSRPVNMVAAPVRRTPNMRLVQANVTGFHLQAMLPDNDEAVSRWIQDFMLPQMEGLNPYEKVEFSQQTLVGREIV